MSEAPETILASYNSNDIAYRRADAPWLPEELTRKARLAISLWEEDQSDGVAAIIALRDILAACEGGK